MGKQRVEQCRAKGHLRIVRFYSKVILGPSFCSVFWTPVYSFTPAPNSGTVSLFLFVFLFLLRLCRPGPLPREGPHPALVIAHNHPPSPAPSLAPRRELCQSLEMYAPVLVQPCVAEMP